MRKLATSSLVSLGLLAGSAGLAGAADPDYRETLIHDTTTTVEIDLNAQTVLCSAADYSLTYLKVGMPELAALTLLDHQNIGANAPCVAAGACGPGNMPDDIIDPAHPTENVAIRVRALRIDEIDTVAATCKTSLVEKVNVTIRGVEFTHTRDAELGSRRIEDCAVAAPAAGGSNDGKADGHGGGERSDVGGCSAVPGAGAGSLVVMLGALLSLRRRSRRA